MRGALLVVARAGGPVYFGKWRDASARQVKRRLGPAWVVPDGGGGWRARRGRPVDGALDERSALLAMAAAMERHEAERLADQPTRSEPTFAEAVGRWLHHQEFVTGVKPSTLADYRYLLAAPGTPARRRGRTPSCRIMRALGPLPLRSITAADVGRYLASLDAEPSVGPRTVNKHRQVLCCVFEHAMRDDTFALAVNPARRTDKRREPDPQPIDFYEPEEALALVRAARAGMHRDPSRPAASLEEHAERDRCDEQDAALFVVAAFTGLRMGELLALRWRNVDFSTLAWSWRRAGPPVFSPRRSRARLARSRWPTSRPACWRSSPRASASPGATTSVLQRRWRLPRRLGAPAPLPARTGRCRLASAALPRPAPLVRQPRHPRV